MFRLALVLALVTGVARLDAAPVKPTKTQTKKDTSKTTKSATKSSKAKAKGDSKKSSKTASKRDGKKAGKQAKRGKKPRYVMRKPTERTLQSSQGMPVGFTWPPSRAMVAAGAECETKLDRAGVKWEHAEAEGRIANPIFVRDMTFGGVKYANMFGSKGPFKMDCQLALALETIGPELHAIGVREVRFGSVFRWSQVRSHGKTRPFLSRHGIGLAMDIGAFVDDSGRVVKVLEAYPKNDQLLLEIEQVVNANGNFRIMLTPKNDPVSHDDHFHIEARADFSAHDVP
jgi:hypothetical protein